MRAGSVVPRMPFPILLFLNPAAGEKQLGAELHGGWVRGCLEQRREAGVALAVDGTQKHHGKVFRHRPEEWGTGTKNMLMRRCGQKINTGQITEKLLGAAVWQIISRREISDESSAGDGQSNRRSSFCPVPLKKNFILFFKFFFKACWTIASIFPGIMWCQKLMVPARGTGGFEFNDVWTQKITIFCAVPSLLSCLLEPMLYLVGLRWFLKDCVSGVPSPRLAKQPAALRSSCPCVPVCSQAL